MTNHWLSFERRLYSAAIASEQCWWLSLNIHDPCLSCGASSGRLWGIQPQVYVPVGGGDFSVRLPEVLGLRFWWFWFPPSILSIRSDPIYTASNYTKHCSGFIYICLTHRIRHLPAPFRDRLLCWARMTMPAANSNASILSDSIMMTYPCNTQWILTITVLRIKSSNATGCWCGILWEVYKEPHWSRFSTCPIGRWHPTSAEILSTWTSNFVHKRH